jgi:hypothetical protein
MMGKNCLKFLSIYAVITEQKTESLFIPHAGPRVQMHISLIYFINDSRLEISTYFLIWNCVAGWELMDIRQ